MFDGKKTASKAVHGIEFVAKHTGTGYHLPQSPEQAGLLCSILYCVIEVQ